MPIGSCRVAPANCPLGPVLFLGARSHFHPASLSGRRSALPRRSRSLRVSTSWTSMSAVSIPVPMILASMRMLGSVVRAALSGFWNAGNRQLFAGWAPASRGTLRSFRYVHWLAMVTTSSGPNMLAVSLMGFDPYRAFAKSHRRQIVQPLHDRQSLHSGLVGQVSRPHCLPTEQKRTRVHYERFLPQLPCLCGRST